MPFRQRGSFGRRRSNLGQVVDSNKNNPNFFTAAATGANTVVNIAIAVDAAANSGAAQVTRGCKIFKIWCEFWVYASAEVAVGVTQGIDFYIMKNPGANLTEPNPGTVGTSNEKKFVFRQFKGLVGARTQGSMPYYWRGWIKIPRVYQRMGADDLLVMVIRPTGSNVIFCHQYIYKWFK